MNKRKMWDGNGKNGRSSRGGRRCRLSYDERKGQWERGQGCDTGHSEGIRAGGGGGVKGGKFEDRNQKFEIKAKAEREDRGMWALRV